MGDREIVDMPCVSTGSIGLDIALGIGGLPQGRVIEFWARVIREDYINSSSYCRVSKAGGTAAFIDAEHALDPNYASKLG